MALVSAFTLAGCLTLRLCRWVVAVINGIRIKVCGITTLVDAEAADGIGADYLGFILYPKSPRFVALTQFVAMSPRLPPRRKVAVMVEPTTSDLTVTRDAGFEFYQIHFRHDLPRDQIAAWSRIVGGDHLWLAPKLPPDVDVAPELRPFARNFLLDTFQVDRFGGTGKTSDWPKFARHRIAHPEHTWILSGGLNPENIVEALCATGATFVDVNSGVESAPGIKDPAKLNAFQAAVRGR